MRFRLNSDPTNDVKLRHRLGGANVVTGEPSRGNKGRIRGEHQENTKRIPREYQGNTKGIPRQHASIPQATGLHMAYNWLVYGLGVAFPDSVPRVPKTRSAVAPRSHYARITLPPRSGRNLPPKLRPGTFANLAGIPRRHKCGLRRQGQCDAAFQCGSDSLMHPPTPCPAKAASRCACRRSPKGLSHPPVLRPKLTCWPGRQGNPP
jgi:hypothetical protein